ncbi:DUF417 family protein [Alloacidobacterium dinghuense]|uniref:DUF417 family protein n=1 Tax=Alloacidobacterium dinghuense TaxID=2763107 RepID=UPI0025521A73|nr:DUF417 family protein [Alloacidobacterium dinghuense]
MASCRRPCESGRRSARGTYQRFEPTVPATRQFQGVYACPRSPLTSWQFKVFGPYILGDMIGATEWTAALLLIIGYFKPKAGILAGIILVGMFFTTSSMLITTPDDTIVFHGIHYMNNLGLFLFKDIISFGVAFYLISYFGKKAILSENKANSQNAAFLLRDVVPPSASVYLVKQDAARATLVTEITW